MKPPRDAIAAGRAGLGDARLQAGAAPQARAPSPLPPPADSGGLALLQRRRLLCSGVGAAATALLSACAGSAAPGAKPEPTRMLDLEFIAADDVNPNEHDEPAPVMVRLYELSSRSTFESADFFQLAGDDKAVLGASGLRQEEFVLRPGEHRRVRRKAHEATTALGVTAAYRDLSHATWRADIELPQLQSHWWDSVSAAPVFRARVLIGARVVRIEPVR